MGIIICVICIVIFFFFIGKAIFSKNGDVTDRWARNGILAVMIPMTVFLFGMIISLFILIQPMNKARSVITKKDTVYFHSFPDQNYLMNHKTRIYSYNNGDLSYQDVDGIKYDSTKKVPLPYMVRFTLVSKDSTIQRLLIGTIKRIELDTLIVSDKNTLKELGK